MTSLGSSNVPSQTTANDEDRNSAVTPVVPPEASTTNELGNLEDTTTEAAVIVPTTMTTTTTAATTSTSTSTSTNVAITDHTIPSQEQPPQVMNASALPSSTIINTGGGGEISGIIDHNISNISTTTVSVAAGSAVPAVSTNPTSETVVPTSSATASSTPTIISSTGSSGVGLATSSTNAIASTTSNSIHPTNPTPTTTVNSGSRNTTAVPGSNTVAPNATIAAAATAAPTSIPGISTTAAPAIAKKAKKRVKDATAIAKDDAGGAVKKKVRKINRNTSGPGGGRGGSNNQTSSNGPNTSSSNHHHPSNASNNGIPSLHNGLIVHDGLSAAQRAAQEQMRRALEEDQYSLVGSIIDTESDDEDVGDGEHPYTTNYTYNYRGSAVRLDKAAMIQAVRKYIILEQRLQQQQQNNNAALDMDHDFDDNEIYGFKDDDEHLYHNDTAGTSTRRSTNHSNHNNKALNKKKKRKDELTQLQDDAKIKLLHHQQQLVNATKDPLSLVDQDDDLDRDGGSIFGATTGQSNSTWVECDKCKKWRRLRGVVDEKKLPSKWYCSMNKNDPERARCSAPEEEYETSHTPESAADSRTRKHLRVWVRRLQCNEAYEARQPTLTRGKKRNAISSSSNHPYEWVRCCNPSCGKWRALLRIMDAKGNVVDRTTDGEWYCVMNNWDEKMASCAAPQENLPAVGCPPWVMQDNH